MKKHKKKIIIAAEIFPPDIGGPATYAQKLAEHFVNEGYVVEVVTYTDKKNKKARFVFGLTQVSRRVPLPFRYYIYACKLFVKSFGASVIYAQGPLSSGLPAKWVSTLLRKRLIVKVVGDQAWERAMQSGKTTKLLDGFLEEKSSGKIRSIQRIQKRVCKKADAVITVSNYFKGVIGKWGINQDNIRVVHNAISVSAPPNTQSPTKPVDGDIILFVGRLTNWKGVSVLIQIMPDLLKENPNFKLVIVGDGPEKEHLQSLAADLKLSKQVLLVGRKSKQEVSKYYQSAMMFVLNSGYENWSHVTLEAMAHQVPVILSNIGGNPELVTNEETGLLVDYNNLVQLKTAISRLYVNKDMRDTYAVNAKRNVDEYSLTDMANATKAILLPEKGNK